MGDEAARALFTIIAWCAPNQPVPPEVLQGALAQRTSWNLGLRWACGMKALYRKACHDLAGLALLQAGDAGPLIHPLLADFGQGLDGAQAGLAALVDVLEDATNAANKTGLPDAFAPLRPHVVRVLDALERLDLEKSGSLAQ